MPIRTRPLHKWSHERHLLNCNDDGLSFTEIDGSVRRIESRGSGSYADAHKHCYASL
jgi:hypothetical protein